MSNVSNISHKGKLDPIKSKIKPLKLVYYYLTTIHLTQNILPIMLASQETIRGELEENAGVASPDPGSTQAGGHFEENQRGCR